MDKCQLHGAFSWCELLTTDTEAAKHFYGKLFNWTLEPAPIPDMEYNLVKYGGEHMGGIMKIPAHCEGTPPHWGVYVTGRRGCDRRAGRKDGRQGVFAAA